MQLFINTRGSLLKRSGERFEIRSDNRSHEFAATKVQSIVVATGVRITSKVMPMCREDFDKVQILGQGFDGEPVADELLTQVI